MAENKNSSLGRNSRNVIKFPKSFKSIVGMCFNRTHREEIKRSFIHSIRTQAKA